MLAWFDRFDQDVILEGEAMKLLFESKVC